MKKSSTYVILIACFRKWISPISFFTILVLLFSGKTQAQSSDPFSRQNQFDYKIFYPQPYLNSPTTSLNQQNNTQWETIQRVEITQPGPSNDPFRVFKVGVNLDQVRNGSGTSPVVPPAVAPWVNGNAGASNAHFAEGWSIPYRCVITDLAAGNHSIDIEWDTRTSGASAIDFVTNYDLLDFAPGSHVLNFNHVQEVLNPIAEAGTWVDGTSTDIPVPNFLNAAAGLLTTLTNYRNSVMAVSNPSGLAKKFSIWNGSITGMNYIAQGSVTASSASSSLRIFFTSTVPAGQSTGTVIIAWGGHIAKGPGVWGDGNSAGNINGSSYHTRMVAIDLDGDPNTDNATNIGQQDRSLSTDAVLDPPICSLNGPNSLQCSATGTFTSGVATSDLANGVTASWAISSDCTGASIVSTDVSSAVVNGGTQCGCTFTLSFTLKKNGLPVSSPCTKQVSVTDNVAPGFTGSYSNVPLGCNPTASDINAALGSGTATDNCGSPSVTASDGSVTGTCTQSQTRTFTARDACGNTTTTSRTVTWKQDQAAPVFTGSYSSVTVAGCNPAASDIDAALGSASATDNCTGTPTITPSDGAETGTCTRSRTRTFTARDGCGNTSTISRTVTWTQDNTPPFISCPANITVQCSADVPPVSTASVTTSDNCGSAITVSQVGSDAVSNSVCANRFTITRTYRARDACGNTSTCAQTITVNDNTAPFISCPAPVTVQCASLVPPVSTASVTTSDNCGGTVTVSQAGTDAISNSTCPNKYTITRTYRATDVCGNTSTCAQTITVNDNTPPTITCPADVVLECSVATTDLSATGSATASDNCGPVIPTYTDNTVTRGCIKYTVRTWKAVDACGNSASCLQNITQTDNTPPVIVCVTVTNGNSTLTATDNCSPQGDIVTYLKNGVWTAIDGSGNIRTATAASVPTCVVAGRMNNTQVTTEQKEQTATTVTEEKANAKAITKLPVIANDIKVNAVPNPFNDRVKFVVTSPQAGYGTLEVMNVLGQKVKTVYQGHINAGEQSFEMSLPVGRYSTLFYILRINGKQVTGKLVQRD